MVIGLVVMGIITAVIINSNQPPEGPTGYSTTVEIPMEDLQSKVEEFFDANGVLGGLEFTNPVVFLEEEGNRIGIKADVSFSFYEVSASGALTSTGKLTYRPAEGSFYVSELEVTAITVERIPALMTEKAKDFVSSGLQKLNPEIRVRTLSEGDLKERAAKLLLKSVEVRAGKLIATVGYEL